MDMAASSCEPALLKATTEKHCHCQRSPVTGETTSLPPQAITPAVHTAVCAKCLQTRSTPRIASRQRVDRALKCPQ